MPILTIYKQAFEQERQVVFSHQEIMQGYGVTLCQDCDGTGRFLLPDDRPMTCVACKGTGKEWVTLGT